MMQQVYPAYPRFAEALISYCLITVYGVSSAIVGMTTQREVSGDLWELVWPIMLATASAVAVWGVLRSRNNGHLAVEIISSVAMVALLVSYSASILARTASDGEVTRLPVAILPILIGVSIFGRLVRLVIRRRPR